MTLTLRTGVDELTSVETLNSNEILSSVLELVRVSEDNLGERSAAARIVHNFLDDTLDISNTAELSLSIELTLRARRNQEF